MKGLYSGRQVIDLKSRSQKITRTQTAKQAYDAIIKKYGQINPHGHYFHVGKGVWHIWSLERDKLRTGKIAPSKLEWSQRPNKSDWPGIDTADSKKKSVRFSTGQLRNSNTLAGRTNKRPISSPLNRTLPFKTFSGLYKDIAYTVNADTRMMSFKWDFSKHNGYHTNPPAVIAKIKDIELNRYAVSKTDANANAKRCIDIIYRGWNNLEQRYRDAASGKYNPDFVAKATKTGKYAEKKKKSVRFSTSAIKAPSKIVGRTTKAQPIKSKLATVKHTGYFGQDLTQGKFGAGANLKRAIIEILKKKYPKTQFLVMKADHKLTNSSWIHIYWSGNPSVRELESLYINMGGQGRKDFRMNKHEVEYHHIDANEMTDRIYQMTRTPSTKAFYQATLFGPKPQVKKSLNLSVTSLKSPAKLSGRKSKSQIKFSKKSIVKSLPKLKAKLSLSQMKMKAPTGRGSKAPIQKHVQVTKNIEIKKSKLYKGFLVTGNTYTIRSQLKAMGGKWVPDEEGWVIPTSAAKQLKAFSKGKKLSIHAFKSEENVFRHFTEAERLERRNTKAEKKIDRWENAATKRSKEAESHYNAAHNLVKDIPLGQPILVGHYTEKAHRRVLERAQNHMFKGVELQRSGETYGEKADSMAYHMKYVNDPTQLKGRIAKLEKELKYWENKLKNNDKEIAGAIAAHKRFTSGSASSEAAFKKQVEEMKGRVNWYKENIDNKKADIASIKDMLPKESTQAVTGITMTDLTKLKKPLGLVSVSKRYHNKNLSGGNFAIELRYGKNLGQGLEISGNHDPDSVVTSLGLYTVRGEYITSIVGKSNYRDMTLEKLLQLLKNALAAVQK